MVHGVDWLYYLMMTGKLLNKNNKVLNFIKRRFITNCNWLTGNCYYFALILKDRFPEGEIYYDVIIGHFVFRLNGINYDWSGVIPEMEKHYYVKWETFNEYDRLEKERIVRDCIL